MLPAFTSSAEMFPDLGDASARVVWDDAGFVVYSLGAGDAPFPWQHVYVRFLPEGGYTVRWLQSVLAAGSVRDPVVARHLPRKQQYFLYGHQVRRLAHEEAMYSSLRRLRRRCPDGDFVRAWQLRAVRSRPTDGLYEALWGDITRVETLRIAALTPTCTRRPPYSGTWLRLARRVLRRHPPPRAAAAAAAAAAGRRRLLPSSWLSRLGWWRWRRKLPGRVQRLYPVLSRPNARAFAAAIGWEAASVGGVV
jgi:hypothetical protein